MKDLRKAVTALLLADFNATCSPMQHSDTPRQIRIEEYRYSLPEERIALYPLQERDASKLLIYKDGQITTSTYRSLPQYLPEGYTLVFNNTRVVQARMQFRKPTGGQIEVFCLEPAPSYPDITTAMLQRGSVQWICLVGGAAKWKAGQELELITASGLTILARLLSRNSSACLIGFEWNPSDLSFAEVLHQAGKVPIPPYIRRSADKTDEHRYQTVYAAEEGSVAAPTAGLHFTDRLLKELTARNIRNEMLTLHVGAGTFQPVKSETMQDHEMHAEFIDVSIDAIRHFKQNCGRLIAVGTTSLRTLETLYWMGVKAFHMPDAEIDQLSIQQWEVYDRWMKHSLSQEDALNALLTWMDNRKTDRLICKTKILLAPGYQIRMVEAIITNFHQPQSTLLLLVAAAIGEDWKKIYQFALENDFRFLSYGDGSLLWCRK